MAFKRNLSSSLIQNLKNEALFKDHLLDDITTKKQAGKGVFPAVRDGKICFYYKGSRLFEYGGEFKAHKKFLSLSKNGNYVSESMLKNKKVQLVDDFCKQYKEIKDAAAQYANLEAVGVSYLYSKYSHAIKKSSQDLSDIVVLDIEVSLDSFEEEKNKDRIDILLYSLKDKKLKFVEAKHFSNPDLWSSDPTKTPPACVDQVIRYNKQINNKQRYDQILKGYTEYIKLHNTLFGLKLPVPQAIVPSCGLYVFGFDQKQKKKIKDKVSFKVSMEALNNAKNSNDLKSYELGVEKDIDVNRLWEEL